MKQLIYNIRKIAIIIFALLWWNDGYTQITNNSLQLGRQDNREKFNGTSKENQLAKSCLDSVAIKHWPTLDPFSGVAISNDGRFCAYIIQNLPYKSKTLRVQSVVDFSVVDFVGVNAGFFSSDSKKYVFTNRDTVFILPTGNSHPTYIIGAYPFDRNKNFCGEWLAFQQKNKPGELMLRNLISNNEYDMKFVSDFKFQTSGNSILLKKIEKRSDSSFTILDLFDLKKGVKLNIWSSSDSNLILKGFTFNDDGDQILLKVEHLDAFKSPVQTSILYYQTGMATAISKIEINNIENRKRYTVSTYDFTKDSQYIVYSKTSEIISEKPHPDYAKVSIWNYKDSILQSAQLYNQNSQIVNTSYYAANLNNGQSFLICKPNEEVISRSKSFFLVKKKTTDDRFWFKKNDSIWLVSLNGQRRLISTSNETRFWFSPFDNFLVYYEGEGVNSHYVSIKLSTGKKINISSNCQFAVVNSFDLPNTIYSRPVGICGWLIDDGGILVYDSNDIWLLDLNGKSKAICMTAHFGKHHSVSFRSLSGAEYSIYNKTEIIYLIAFNSKTKQNGFYRLQLNAPKAPEELYMGDHLFKFGNSFQAIGTGLDFNHGATPMRARDANLWIVMRQSFADAPNYYLTSNFKEFKPLSNLHPQRSYNWITAELVSFKLLDGTLTQGILYKPENFDPSKKYPVLLNYYVRLTQRLFQFPKPDFVSANIDIPWFVSRGYLVFTPDIRFVKGRSGYSALNTVVSAAKWLSKLSFVDSKSIGIQGHSYGGGLTNYIVSHTSLFTAAVEGAGTCDAISSALQLSGRGDSRLDEELVLGYSIWEKPDRWLANSSILNANRVETPLLIMHNQQDGAVPWQQAIELFISLRRLNKKSWMLQYDNGTHVVHDRDAEDYTFRITQFFNHFLKGAPAPLWMTQGIPARLKQIETGYALDPSGNCGNDCKVCKSWNEKWKKDSLACKKEMEQWEKF